MLNNVQKKFGKILYRPTNWPRGWKRGPELPKTIRVTAVKENFCHSQIYFVRIPPGSSFNCIPATYSAGLCHSFDVINFPLGRVSCCCIWRKGVCVFVPLSCIPCVAFVCSCATQLPKGSLWRIIYSRHLICRLQCVVSSGHFHKPVSCASVFAWIMY